MDIIEIKNKEVWNSWVGAQPFSQFLQSWEWGEFHKKMGRKVWRFAVAGDAINRVSATDENIILVAQVIKYNLPFGQSYLYCPRGPVSKFQISNPFDKLRACPEFVEGTSFKFQKDIEKLFFDKIKQLAREDVSIFFRVEPVCSIIGTGHCPVRVGDNRLRRTKQVQPANEWVLDLEKSEKELLKEMNQKTRYNIRLAEKKGAKIRKGECDNDFEQFFSLISNTYSRKDIRTHSKEYYKGILEIGDININNNVETRQWRVSTDARIELWIAEYKNKIIATNIISCFGDTATYMHGGADYEYRNLMAPYLLQWEAIKDAKAMGYKYYDFGGVSGGEEFNSTKAFPLRPTLRVGNSWAGITRFKKGFGGFKLNYEGTYEVEVNRLKYFIYKMAKRLQ